MALYATLILQGGGPNRAGTRCSDFRRDNPHLEIGAGGRLGPDHPAADLLDFRHEESRAERFGIVDEVMSDYPVDGFELQFNAAPHYFHPDDVEAGRGIMTDWVGRVHDAVKRAGVDKELVVRVPDRLDDCLDRGLDPEEWVRRGLVDVLVPEAIGDNYQRQADGRLRRVPGPRPGERSAASTGRSTARCRPIGWPTRRCR